MIIISADDWGRSRSETDRTLSCYEANRITSVSAMVFMRDSERAAELARGADIDVGLHLNFNERYNGHVCSPHATEVQDRIVRVLTRSKYSVVVYHPFLRKQFREVYRTQVEEFVRLYGKPPSHVDGHHHGHLCANMIIEEIIPRGQRVRRNITFPRGEKGLVNRTYRRLVDQWLGRRYCLTDYLFELSWCIYDNQLERVIMLAKEAKVELITHPVREEEYACLMSDTYIAATRNVQTAAYSLL